MNFDQTAFGAAILLNKMQDIFNLNPCTLKPLFEVEAPKL
jgi:hypothetical protein